MIGAATAALGGGNVAQGALGAAASELASGAMQDYLKTHDIKPNSATGNTLMNLGSAAIGATTGQGAGAATALQGDKYNRQLHSNEKQRLKMLAGDDQQQYLRLAAAACALVNCAAEYPEGSEDRAYYSKLQQWGNTDELADERAWLSQQTVDVPVKNTPADWALNHSTTKTQSLYTYTPTDKAEDTLKRLNATYDLTPRMGGSLQAGGALVSGIAGLSMTATGGASCTETLVRCALVPVGMGLTAWGSDQFQAGVNTAINGTPAPTFGSKALQKAFDLSPENAELLYGAIGGIGDAAAGSALLRRATASLQGSATLEQDGLKLGQQILGEQAIRITDKAADANTTAGIAAANAGHTASRVSGEVGQAAWENRGPVALGVCLGYATICANVDKIFIHTEKYSSPGDWVVHRRFREVERGARELKQQDDFRMIQYPNEK